MLLFNSGSSMLHCHIIVFVKAVVHGFIGSIAQKHTNVQ
jgi:hypothetical protein